MANSVAVITGANSGIGLEIARQLLSTSTDPLTLVLACRNMSKAQSAKEELLRAHPSASIDLLQVDTSSPLSAIGAAREIKEKYQCIKWLFCNAGIMPLKGMSLKCHFNKEFWANLFQTGEGILVHDDWTTEDGLQAVFATNVLGHYLMIKELEDYLISQTTPTHIIWTSSNSAKSSHFDPTDIQNKKRDGPYPHSKRLIDLLSLHINSRLNEHGIYSNTACPGMVISQITTSIMPLFIWYLTLPVIFIIRLLLVHFITFKPENGVLSLMWLAKQDPVSVDHSIKYFSRTPPWGPSYVHREKIPFQEDEITTVVKEINKLVEYYLLEYQTTTDN